MSTQSMAGLRTRLGDERGAVTVWAISMTVACVLLIGLVLDGGALLRARSDAFAVAASAARAGAQQLDPDAAVAGAALIDPAAAQRAAADYLSRAGVSGTVTVTGSTITVTVTSSARFQLLPVAAGSVTATASVDAIKVELR